MGDDITTEYNLSTAPLEDALDVLKDSGLRRCGSGPYEGSAFTICPLCLDPIKPSNEAASATNGGGKQEASPPLTRPSSPTRLPSSCSHSHLYHGGCLHAKVAMSIDPPFTCPFCRPDTKVMGTEAIAKLVCEAMASKHDDPVVQLKATRAMVVVGYRNPAALELLELCDAPALVCESLAKHGDHHRRLAGAALEAIIVLCQCDLTGKHRLRDINAPALVCGAMKKHHDKTIEFKGITAIAHLARLDPANVLQSEWADASFLVLGAMKTNYLNTAVLLQGLEAIEALSHYGLHHDSALIAAEVHRLLPALLLANLADTEVVQIALRVLNRILTTQQACEFFCDAPFLTTWMTKAMGCFQSEMKIQRGFCDLISTLARHSDLCRHAVAGVVIPFLCKLLRGATCPPVLISGLQAVSSLIASPNDDVTVAEHLGSKDMCTAVVKVIRVCLTSNVQSRDVYLYALKAMNALTIEPANRQRLIQCDVRALLEKLYKTYRKDNDIQTELSFLAESIVFDRQPTQWEQVTNAMMSSFKNLGRITPTTDLGTSQGSQASPFSGTINLTDQQENNDLLLHEQPLASGQPAPAITTTMDNIQQSEGAPNGGSSRSRSSSSDKGNNNNNNGIMSFTLFGPKSPTRRGSSQQDPCPPPSPFRLIASLAPKPLAIDTTSNVAISLDEQTIGAVLEATTTTSSTVPKSPKTLPDVIVKGNPSPRSSTGGAHHGRPSKEGITTTNTTSASTTSPPPPQVNRNRASSLSPSSRRQPLVRLANDTPAMITRQPLRRISERGSSSRSLSVKGSPR